MLRYANLACLAAVSLLVGSQGIQRVLAGETGIFQDGFEHNASEQIAAARALPDGPASEPIDKALVTYVKPLIGNDVAGFFVQASKRGPALFIAVDPADLLPQPAAGDEVSFTITEMGSNGDLRQATQIANFVRNATQVPLASLVQDISTVTDAISLILEYESELITLEGVIAESFAPSGTGFEAAQVNTTGLSGDSNLKLRLPSGLADAESLASGCYFSLGPTPLWRFFAQAQPSAWDAADISATLCPAPVVESATALSATSVEVTFSRTINAASVNSSGDQFVFSDGLLASGASASGQQVTVTTSPQTPDHEYLVVVQDSVTDVLGTGLGVPKSAAFSGFQQAAQVVINEVNANITSGCDLVELRVVNGGTLHGFQLWERNESVLTFSELNVATGDIVVVHFNGSSVSCTIGILNETISKTQYPNAMFAGNYDSAWDWYSIDAGITSTDNVITIYDFQGEIQDAVFLSDDATGMSAIATEAQAAAVAEAGQWQMVGGGVPMGGFVDDNFSAHAALDLNGTGTSATGESIQRAGNSDSNTKADWGQAAQSWGALNTGQTP